MCATPILLLVTFFIGYLVIGHYDGVGVIVGVIRALMT